MSHLNRNEVTSQGSFELHFAMITDNEHLHVFFLAKYIHVFLKKMVYSGFLTIFNWVICVIILKAILSAPYMFCTLDQINGLQKHFFSHYIGNFLFHFLCWSKTFLCRSTFYFVSVLCALGVISKESIAKATDKSFYRFLLILLASGLTFRSLIHSELVFMHNSITFFCRWIFRFPNNVYLETNPFSVVQS